MDAGGQLRWIFHVTFAADNVTPNWVTDDKIAVKVGDGTADELTLSTGNGTASGKFTGSITPATGTTMYAYYPASAATAVDGKTFATDLTNQKGTVEDAASKVVMFASADYSSSPTFSFKNKVSILKLNMVVPNGVTFDTTTDRLYVKVVGAYSKGTLTTNGTWSNLSYDVINVSDAKIVEESGTKKISAYIVVIPDCNVSNIRIMVGGKVSGSDTYKNYITDAYVSTTATVAENKIITITKSLRDPEVNYKDAYAKYNYYKWDASDSYTKDGSYNTYDWSDETIDLTKPDYGTNSWTKQCPTYQQISIMLGNGVKWVANASNSGGKDYTLEGVTGTKYSGLWLKKLVYCDISQSSPQVFSSSFIKTEIPNNGQYFFLPAAGYYYNGYFFDAGSDGYFWSSTPNDDNGSAFGLYIGSIGASLDRYNRGLGFLPWCAE